MQNIYRGREFKFYNEFMELRNGLLEDFLKIHAEFSNLQLPPADMAKYFPGSIGIALKYDTNNMENYLTSLVDSDCLAVDVKSNYPTAYEHILKKFPECIIASYNVLKKHSIIKRHTDTENRTNKYIKIHIPLIIPEGDVGFEVDGEIVDWTNLFAFDDQKVHSAWNKTNQDRLVFVISLPRVVCGIPAGIPWSKDNEETISEFLKTAIAN